MDLIGNLAEAVTIKQDQNFNRQNEEFKITDARVDFNEFNLTVKNIGTIPINITRMWAQNITDSSWNQSKYQLNQLVSAGGSVSNIGQGTGLVAIDSQSYSLKLVTERGNSLNTQVLSASNQPLEMTLFTTPASPLSQQNVTLLYSVKNNLTAGSIIPTLTPQMDPPTTTGAAIATLKLGPTPASVEGLAPGEIAFFEWTYHVTGNNVDKIKFNATVANAVPGNFVTDGTQIAVPPVSEVSVNKVIGLSLGIISMNYTSFEVCEPDASNCFSDSTDWSRAWLINTSTEYIWRMNVTNNGIEDILIDKFTALFVLRAETGGGGNLPRAFFVMDDSTPTVENGGAFTTDSKILAGNGGTNIVYFGAKGEGGAGLENTHGDTAIYAANLLIFGYEDRDKSATTNVPPDQPYSQNLPFQALRMI